MTNLKCTCKWKVQIWTYSWTDYSNLNRQSFIFYLKPCVPLNKIQNKGFAQNKRVIGQTIYNQCQGKLCQASGRVRDLVKVNNSHHHIFMMLRRQKTPESQLKDSPFLTAITRAENQHFCCTSLSTPSQGVTQRGPNNTFTPGGLCESRTLSFKT